VITTADYRNHLLIDGNDLQEDDENDLFYLLDYLCGVIPAQPLSVCQASPGTAKATEAFTSAEINDSAIRAVPLNDSGSKT
jgi:hypothetical protein